MDSMNIIYPVLSLGGIGITLGALLGYASQKFAVEVDERVPLVRDALPGANCGGCGFAGCDAFAKAVVEGDARPNGCPVGGAQSAEKIGEVLGLKVEMGEKTSAYVKCNGTCNNAKEKYKYYGITDCVGAANIPGGGSKSCGNGCLGLGSCVKVCDFGAIDIVDGIAFINEDKCTSCGKCVNICPKTVIEIVPVSKRVRVECNSVDKGKDTRDNCKVGCIACKMCERACQYEAIEISNNLARVKYENCTQCGACVLKCPTKSIKTLVSGHLEENVG
jgi:Na+-translocating ferredoxin:NAD+ oxidoreductase subunit B